jgi:flagellar protein FlaG
LNQQLSDSGRALGFRLDSVLNRPVVTVTNQSTGEVVRQIPTEVVVRVAHSIEALKGLIFDKAT